MREEVQEIARAVEAAAGGTVAGMEEVNDSIAASNIAISCRDVGRLSASACQHLRMMFANS